MRYKRKRGVVIKIDNQFCDSYIIDNFSFRVPQERRGQKEPPANMAKR